jgi:hypothetical protein
MLFEPALRDDLLAVPPLRIQEVINYVEAGNFEFSLDGQRVDRAGNFAHQTSSTSVGSSIPSACKRKLDFPFLAVVSSGSLRGRVEHRVTSVRQIGKQISLLGEDDGEVVLSGHDDIFLSLLF